MNKLSTCLWFDTNAEEAMNFYLSIFKNSKKLNVLYYGKGMPMPEGTVLTANFEINGYEFLALNGGLTYKFTPAVSFVVNCENQEEIDNYWEKLSEGGHTERCGWLVDKFGISWQIVPSNIGDLMRDSDAKRAQRVMDAILKMDKLEIKKLQEAYEYA